MAQKVSQATLVRLSKILQRNAITAGMLASDFDEKKLKKLLSEVLLIVNETIAEQQGNEGRDPLDTLIIPARKSE